MKSIYLFVLLLLPHFSSSQHQPELITQEKNLGLITKIVYSPDGRYIASANEKDFTIKVWDIRSDKMLGSLPGHSAHIQDLFFDASGETIYSFGKDDKNYIWDLNEWKLKDSITASSKIEKMKLHPDAKTVFSLSEKMELMRTDLTTHLTEVFIAKQKNPIQDFCVSEKFLILGFLDGSIQVWDLSTKKQIKKWSNSGKVDFLFVDKENLVVGLNPGVVHTFSLTDYSLKADFQSPVRNVVAFNAKTSTIAFAGAQDHLVTMNYLTGEKTNSWKVENSSSIRSLSLSPDGSALAVSGFKRMQLGRRMNENNIIQIWDIKTKRILHTLKGEVEALDAFAFAETENKLFVLRGSALHIWDLNTAERIATTTLHERKIEMKEHAREAAEEKKDEAKERVESSNANDLIGIASGGLGGLKDRAKNKLNETKTSGIQDSKEIGKAAFTRLGFQENRIMISRTGKYLVTALKEDEIRLYAFKNGIPEYVDFIRTKQKEFYDMILDPDEKFLVVGGNGDEPVSIIPLDSTRRAIKLDVNDYENRKLGGVFQTANALAFSPDGKKLIAVFNNGRIVVWEKEGWYKLTDFRLKAAMTMKPFAGFSKDGTKFFINTANGVYTYDFTIYANAPSGKQMQMGDALGVKKSTIEGFPVMTHVALDYVVSITKGAVNFLEVATDKTISSDPIHAKWITDIQVNKFGYAGISLRNGELRIYDPSTGKQRFIMVEEEDNAIFKTPDNYYKITKEGQDLVTFRLGKDAFPFEQFDAKYNRPDIVLQAMHSEDANMIKLYKSAYEKRLSKLGLKESDLEVTANLPQLTVNNLAEIPLSTGEKKLTLNISAKDELYDLQKIMVWINDVPIYGKGGKPITGKSFDGALELNLASGSNKIQIACENIKGTVSLKETIEMECTQKVKPVLYLITIGTSNYKDKKFNLNYAAKDALDITKVYANNPNGTFSSVKTKTITNEQVTKLNIVGLSTFLKDATIDDVVLVFVAGHGVLDASLDYYYGTYDIDFTKPAAKGLTYLALESLLDGIAPLKKMMFMDTCHSGEVEKEEVTVGGQVEKNEKVKFRDAGTGPVIQGTAGMSPSKMMKELFNDLRRGTGTTVISSAGGTEFAMESDEWKNGLFTYCLLSGLTTSLADLNKDGSIMLSEMQIYLTDEVTKLSGGKQVPTTRIGNISLDYKIW